MIILVRIMELYEPTVRNDQRRRNPESGGVQYTESNTKKKKSWVFEL
jgi:hypothetical protein